ncbi:MAG: hypothetical protein WCL04_02150 [Verrucomicrobiota bacterium]
MDKHEQLALAAIALVAAGIWLRWRLDFYCSDAEEDVKDKKITAEQARRRIAFIKWGVPAVTILGLLLLTEAFSRWFSL